MTWAIQCEQFGVAFGSRVVLADVRLEIAAAKVSVLLGPVGTGKSTLLRALAGGHEGNARCRTWGGLLHFGLAPSPDNLPRLVQQQARVLQSSVFDVLAAPIRESGMVPPTELRDRIESRLVALGVPEVRDLLTHQTLDVARPVQRIVSIVSASLAEARVLLLDEPTSGLSDYDAYVVCDLIRTLVPMHTVVVSMHNQKQARDVGHHAVLLAGGRVVADGPVPDFFESAQNDAHAQFLSTGSCALPSPSASTWELEPGVPLPPPLPEAALELIGRGEPTMRLMGPAVPARAPLPVDIELEVTVDVPLDCVAADTNDTNAQAAADGGAVPIDAAGCVRAPTQEVAAGRDLAASAQADDVGSQGAQMYVGRRGSRYLNAGAGMALTRQLSAEAVPESRGPRGFAWVVPGHLAGTPLPGAVHSIDYDLKALKGVGITTLITLTERDVDQAALQRHGVKNLHLPIKDREPPTIAQTHMLLIRMQQMLDKGEVLAVHCLAGLGRTGTVLAAWLIREGGLSADAAVARLRRIHPGFVQTDEQVLFLHEFEAAFLQDLQ